jgi:hypothetical protein
MMDGSMAGLNWDEFLVVGLLALCVLGPIFVVLLTQNLLDTTEDIGAEHFEFDAIAKNLDDAEQPPGTAVYEGGGPPPDRPGS